MPLSVQPQWAQQTATHRGGILRTASGQPIPGATVEMSAQGSALTGRQHPTAASPSSICRPAGTCSPFGPRAAEPPPFRSIFLSLNLTRHHERTAWLPPLRQQSSSPTRHQRRRTAFQRIRLASCLSTGRDFSTFLLLKGTMTDVNGANPSYAAICHQRPAWRRSRLRHGRSRHQRSGDGRFHLLQLQRRRRRGNQVQLRLDAREIGRGAAGFTDIITRARVKAAFMDP